MTVLQLLAVLGLCAGSYLCMYAALRCYYKPFMAWRVALIGLAVMWSLFLAAVGARLLWVWTGWLEEVCG